MSPREEDVAAGLLERLLSDPAYRAAFRADPIAASREAGLESVAAELAANRGKVMQTLDGRESRSNLAGVLMAAAFEGAAIVDFSRSPASSRRSHPTRRRPRAPAPESIRPSSARTAGPARRCRESMSSSTASTSRSTPTGSPT
jgi:hypothetical protein